MWQKAYNTNMNMPAYVQCYNNTDNACANSVAAEITECGHTTNSYIYM